MGHGTAMGAPLVGENGGEMVMGSRTVATLKMLWPQAAKGQTDASGRISLSVRIRAQGHAAPSASHSRGQSTARQWNLASNHFWSMMESPTIPAGAATH